MGIIVSKLERRQQNDKNIAVIRVLQIINKENKR